MGEPARGLRRGGVAGFAAWSRRCRSFLQCGLAAARRPPRVEARRGGMGRRGGLPLVQLTAVRARMKFTSWRARIPFRGRAGRQLHHRRRDDGVRQAVAGDNAT